MDLLPFGGLVNTLIIQLNRAATVPVPSTTVYVRICHARAVLPVAGAAFSSRTVCETVRLSATESCSLDQYIILVPLLVNIFMNLSGWKNYSLRQERVCIRS